VSQQQGSACSTGSFSSSGANVLVSSQPELSLQGMQCSSSICCAAVMCEELNSTVSAAGRSSCRLSYTMQFSMGGSAFGAGGAGAGAGSRGTSAAAAQQRALGAVLALAVAAAALLLAE
jgi:hypothetical protein